MWQQLALEGGKALGGALFSSIGRDARNREARAQNKRQRMAIKEDWRYRNRLGKQKRDFAQNEVKIGRRNQDKNIELQQLQADQARDYGMQIRQFDYDRAFEMQAQQKMQADQQQIFNQQAYEFALLEQQNYKFEQNLNLDLAELETGVKSRQGVASYQMSQRQLDAQQRAARSKNSFDTQTNRIDGLKALGMSEAKGQSGRTAAKNAQATIAEFGFKQAQIAEATTQAGEQYTLTSQQNVQDLSKLSQELITQKAEIKFSRSSLERAETFTKIKLEQQLQQANAEALNSIMLDPILAPELPEVPNFADYKAEFQDIPKWIDLPEPELPTLQQDSGNFFTDLLGQSGGLIGMGVSALADKSVNKPPSGDTNTTINGGQFNSNNFNTDFGMDYGFDYDQAWGFD